MGLPIQPVFDEYAEFLQKFERKKTTDDCYTPENIYGAVLDWASRRYGFDQAEAVRPFWPNSDYQLFDYPDGCVVVDNPPFSILSKIVRFYLARHIHFFLFAPGLSSIVAAGAANTVCIGEEVEYANGAKVNTGFVTDLGGNAIETAPDLSLEIRRINDENRREKTKQVRRFSFPDEVMTAAKGKYLAGHGVRFAVKREDAVYSSDACGEKIFGGCFLLSPRRRRKGRRRKGSSSRTPTGCFCTWHLETRRTREMDDYRDEPLGWGARIAIAIGMGLLLLLLAWGFAEALSYDDYSADYWDPTGRYRQIDEERRLDREAQERDWAARDTNNKEER